MFNILHYILFTHEIRIKLLLFFLYRMESINQFQFTRLYAGQPQLHCDHDYIDFNPLLMSSPMKKT